MSQYSSGSSDSSDTVDSTLAALSDLFDVIIDGERYLLLDEPKENSRLVTTRNISNQIGRPLLDYMPAIGEFIYIAYHGVNAAGPNFCELQSAVFKILHDIAKLCADSVDTVIAFADRASSITKLLKLIYEHLVEGHEKVATKRYKAVENEARKMADAACDLKVEFKEEEEKVLCAIDMVHEEKCEEAKRKDSLKNKYRLEKDMASSCSHAKGGKLSKFASPEERLSAFGSCITSISPLVQEIEEESTKKEALAKFKMKKIKKEADLAEMSVCALHEALTALKCISNAIGEAENYWKNIERHCQELANENMCSFVEEIDLSSRQRYWRSEGFMRAAIKTMANWVNFRRKCMELMTKLAKNTQTLYGYVAQNSTHKESLEILKAMKAIAVPIETDEKIVSDAKKRKTLEDIKD